MADYAKVLSLGFLRFQMNENKFCVTLIHTPNTHATQAYRRKQLYAHTLEQTFTLNAQAYNLNTA